MMMKKWWGETRCGMGRGWHMQCETEFTHSSMNMQQEVIEAMIEDDYFYKPASYLNNQTASQSVNHKTVT